MFAVLNSIDLYSFQNGAAKKSRGADLWSYAPPSFDWSAIHQSGVRSLDIFTMKYSAYFLINFESESDHTIEKIVLFRSTQGRPFYLVPFKSYKNFPETPDFS